MAFADPFPGLDRNLNRDGDLVRALRLDLAAEEEAIHLYTSHADGTDNVMVKAMLTDIANEERVHSGELLRLIDVLTEDEQDFILKGYKEVEDKFPKVRYGILPKE